MSEILRPFEDGNGNLLGYRAWCPGCEESHVIYTEAARRNGARWQFDGNLEQPTFKPSLLVRTGHYAPSHREGDGCWCGHEEEWGHKCVRCHSFISNGQWQFLGDCTHGLAGQTVPMVPWPIAEGDTA